MSCALSSSTSLIYRPAVSRMPFISSFTVLRHDLRCIRMRNDGIARPRSFSRPRVPSHASLPSFLPSSTYGFRRVGIPSVIFSSAVARRRKRMLQRTPLIRLRRKSRLFRTLSLPLSLSLSRSLSRCGRSQ